MTSSNLSPRRGPSVWDRESTSPGWRGAWRPGEWGRADWMASPGAGRWMVAAAGAALALSGLRRRGPAGALMAIAGGTLAARAASGADDIAAFKRVARRLMGGVSSPDHVDVEGDESFPASDAPSWTSSSAIGRCP